MRIPRIVNVLIFLLAALVLIVRGPARMMRAEFNDLSTPYVSARLWLRGLDPYQQSSFMQEWTRAGGVRFTNRGSSTTTRPAYPPPTLPALAPLAILPWKVARIVFALLATALYGFVVWKLRKASPLTLAIVVGMSSVGTAIGGGNLAILAIELAVLAGLDPKPTRSGLLLGLSICLKPQLGAWLLLYYLLTRKWRIASTAIATASCLLALALLRLPSTWSASYKDNLSHFFSIGGVNDFTTANPSRFELVNLQVVAFSIVHDYAMSNLIAWTLTGILLAAWAVWCIRKDHGLLAMGTVALIGLLPVYQRFYNLPIVLLVIVWAIHEKKIQLQRIFALLVIPWTALIERFSNDRMMTGPVYHAHWLLQAVALPWITWFLLAVISVGLWRMRPVQTRRAPASVPHASPQKEMAASAAI